MSNRQLLPRSELEAAEIDVRSMEAQIRSAEAQVTQAQASLNQNEVKPGGTRSSRRRSTGSSSPATAHVARTLEQRPRRSSCSPPAWRKMQVVAKLDESDVDDPAWSARLVPLRWYPAEDFTGTVAQVRLQPIVQQNVVT